MLIAALVVGLSVDAFARSTARKDRAISTSGISVTGIADGDKETVEVDTYGRLEVKDVAGHTVASQWGDGLVYTGKCIVQSIHVQSDTISSYAEVYDAVSATGTAKFDPQMGTALDSKHVDVGGVFETGIYVNATGGEGSDDSDVLVTIVYDPI